MKNNSFGLSMFRPVRFLVVAFTCALVFFSSAFPAAAVNNPTSSLQDGTTQLLGTQKETDKVATEPPLGLKEVQKKSNEGLNEVQGSADIEKQKTPANSQDATTVEDQIGNILNKATGKS